MGEAVKITRCPTAYLCFSAGHDQVSAEDRLELQQYEVDRDTRKKSHAWGPGKHPRSRWKILNGLEQSRLAKSKAEAVCQRSEHVAIFAV